MLKIIIRFIILFSTHSETVSRFSKFLVPAVTKRSGNDRGRIENDEQDKNGEKPDSLLAGSAAVRKILQLRLPLLSKRRQRLFERK